MSPDWADKPEAVPYSSLDNPQSLNLYAYVGNNPLSKVDKDGHEAGSVPDQETAMAAQWGAGIFVKTISDFATAHPQLTNALVNVALAFITKGDSEGGVSLPRLTEGEAVSSAPSMGAAQREVMRQEGIPTSQQPSSQQSTPAGRQYTYEVPKDGGGTETKIVQRNNGTDRSHPGQPYVEGGSPKPGIPTPTDSIGRPRLDSNKTKVNVDRNVVPGPRSGDKPRVQ